MNHLILFNNGVSKNRVHFIRKVLTRRKGDNVTLKEFNGKSYDGTEFNNIFFDELEIMEKLMFNQSTPIINKPENKP